MHFSLLPRVCGAGRCPIFELEISKLFEKQPFSSISGVNIVTGI